METIVPPFRRSACRRDTKVPHPGGGGGRGGAGDAIRTRDIYLGKVVLYQLSYSRERLWCQGHLTARPDVGQGTKNSAGPEGCCTVGG
jgi:hypothetical protein